MVKKTHASEIGKGVPKNLKFGVIVAVALFWAEFLKTFFNTFWTQVFIIQNPLFSDFFMAIIVTVAGYFVLVSWRKIKRMLWKLEVPKSLQ